MITMKTFIFLFILLIAFFVYIFTANNSNSNQSKQVKSVIRQQPTLEILEDSMLNEATNRFKTANRYQTTANEDIPDPDILIRTGGHQRLSNFMLWQLAYTELFFKKIMAGI